MKKCIFLFKWLCETHIVHQREKGIEIRATPKREINTAKYRDFADRNRKLHKIAAEEIHESPLTKVAQEGLIL